MKRRIHYIAPLLLAISGAVASAQTASTGASRPPNEHNRDWEISLFFGRSSSTSKSTSAARERVVYFDDFDIDVIDSLRLEQNAVGFRATRRLTDRWSVEGSLAFANSARSALLRYPASGTSFPGSTGSGTALFSGGDTYNVDGGVRYSLLRFGRVDFFLTGAVGLTVRTGLGVVTGVVSDVGDPSRSIFNSFELDALHSGYLAAGGGAKFPMGKVWGIRGDVRSRYVRRELGSSSGVYEFRLSSGHWYLDWSVGPYFEF
jgi:hypothetical protein